MRRRRWRSTIRCFATFSDENWDKVTAVPWDWLELFRDRPVKENFLKKRFIFSPSLITYFVYIFMCYCARKCVEDKRHKNACADVQSFIHAHPWLIFLARYIVSQDLVLIKVVEGLNRNLAISFCTNLIFFAWTFACYSFFAIRNGQLTFRSYQIHRANTEQVPYCKPCVRSWDFEIVEDFKSLEIRFFGTSPIAHPRYPPTSILFHYQISSHHRKHHHQHHRSIIMAPFSRIEESGFFGTAAVALCPGY